MTGPVLSLRLWRALTLADAPHPVAAGVAAQPLVPPRGCVPTLLLFVVLSQLFLVALLAASVFGALWAALIARDIRRRHATSTFAVLATTPDGPFGLAWRVAVGAVNRAQLLARFRRRTTWLLRGGVVFMGLVVLAGLVIGPAAALWGRGLIALAVFWADNVQTIVLSVLLGVHVGALARDPLAAQVGAAVAVVMVQAASYALLLGASYTLLLGVLWGPLGSFEGLYLGGVLLLTDAFGVVVYLLLREALVVALWRSARARYGGVAVQTASGADGAV